MITNNFIDRHIGPNDEQIKIMLDKLGLNSIEELIDLTIPKSIRLKEDIAIPEGMNEFEFMELINKYAQKNKTYRSYIGLGYYNTIVPGVIQRNVLENPGWYTSYTPYQAEISQGRLEALLIFQTMVSDLTNMPVSNCSLLDEGTAAAEAMIMSFNTRTREKVKRGDCKFFVSNGLFPQSISVISTRAEYLGIEVVVGEEANFEFGEEYFGAIIQYPNVLGDIKDYAEFTRRAHEKGIVVSVATDLMCLALVTPPGEWGADIVIGSAQRFGTPLAYGGPHAAFLATKDDYKRKMPGRIIGVSKDKYGKKAYRMALQTREQHIKRQEATSNICTAQALLAMMNAFYAVYHGKEGIKQIARHINTLTIILADKLTELGFVQKNKNFFDTVCIKMPNNVKTTDICRKALERQINFRFISDSELSISVDETTSLKDINEIIEIFAFVAGKEYKPFVCDGKTCAKFVSLSDILTRKSDFLKADIFKKYHSETAMMRYLKYLENKDLSLNRSMIPLGSCTMKLNASAWMFPLSMPAFSSIHPFVPQDQAMGYKELIDDFSDILLKVTGFKGITFQPNSGASGEYTGLIAIRAYQKNKGEAHRDVCLIPASAHGTNPASAAMAGLKIVVVNTDVNGNIDVEDFKAKAQEYKNTLSCTMITYPSTHGVFEEDILTLVQVVHNAGGLVYLDGANMNAQVGYTSPGFIGADVCHLNLHKTFGNPHGGGGPGVGPVCVAEHLVPFLPTHPLFGKEEIKSLGTVSAAHFGSAFILPISYGYCKMLGGEGMKRATAIAILNANYIRKSLENYYKILYVGLRGMCAHEMILDCNEFKKTINLEVIDIAKRLMDYGLHAPTVAFPVHGTLMVEPTESEPLEELDRFIEAMISIRNEIKEIEDGSCDIENNCIKNAPHTCELATSEKWSLPYSREKACFPVGYSDGKYWATVTKIDDAFGDRNLVTVCE